MIPECGGYRSATPRGNVAADQKRCRRRSSGYWRALANIFRFRVPVRIFALPALCALTVFTSPLVFAGEVVLQDDQLLAAFDSDSGALTRLVDKSTGWVVERRPELAQAFRLFAPLPQRRWDPVLVGNNTADYAALFGPASVRKQLPVQMETISAHQLRLQWKDLASESDGVLPMTLTAEVTLTHGALTFRATLENNSALTVETIDFPCLGDLNPPTRQTPLEIRVMRNGRPDDLQADEIYPHFRNEKGYWGVFWPLKTREAQPSLFCLVSAPDQGIFAQVDAPKAPYRMQYTFELHPGVISSINNLVPPEDEISGLPVHLEFRVCHFLFAKPHSTVALAPITLRCYRGDWRAGVEFYHERPATPAPESAK